jgi:HEAT repeat protein
VTPLTDPLDIVLAWIECEDECAPSLQAVLQRGPEATPILIQIVTEGPPPAQMETMQAHLQRTYRELAAYSETHPEAALRMGEAEYVGLYLGNYTAQYQIRSAQALVAIGDPQAFGPIQDALRSTQRPDVRDALQQALRALG